MILSHRRIKPRTAVVTAIAVLAASLLVMGPAYAQNNGNGQHLTIATFNIQQVFQQYAGRQQMTRQMRQAQQKAQQAAKSGHRKQAQQEQLKAQQLQQQMIQKFRSRLQKAAAKVAEDQHIPVVANNLTYKSKQVKTKDITKPIVQVMNKHVPAGNQSMQQPGTGQQRGQRQGRQQQNHRQQGRY